VAFLNSDQLSNALKSFKISPGPNLTTSEFTTTTLALCNARALFQSRKKYLFSKRTRPLVALSIFTALALYLKVVGLAAVFDRSISIEGDCKSMHTHYVLRM
jgi:hypothetical protein